MDRKSELGDSVVLCRVVGLTADAENLGVDARVLRDAAAVVGDEYFFSAMLSQVPIDDMEEVRRDLMRIASG